MITLKKLCVRVRGPNVKGQKYTYTFMAYELPTGPCVVFYDNTHDAWYADRDAIDACGMDVILSVTDTGDSMEWEEERVFRSVTGSAREFGADAVPESLRGYIKEGLDDRT